MTPQTDAPTTAPSTTTASAAAVVPDRAALEGLEAKWAGQWKADDTYAFDRTRPRERGLLDRHSPADGLGVAARGPRVLLHPHRPGGALPADAGQVRLLPDGLGRQRAADRAPGAEPLRRPVRPVAPVRRRLHPAREARPQAPAADQPTELRRAVRGPRRAGRADLRGPVANPRPLGRLEAALHDDRSQGADDQPARVPAQPRPRGGLPAGGADAVGRHVPDGRRAGRARGPRVRRRLPPGGLPREPTDRSTSRPPGPS